MTFKDLLKDTYKEGMTLEEIETALESITLPTDSSAEIDKLKTALSKSNSEAADFKRQLREKLSADELKAKEDAEKQEKLQHDYDELLKKVTVTENKAQLLAIGYDDALATETAEAMVNGDIAKVFVNQKKHIDAVEKKVRSELTKGTPKPNGGNSGVGITKEDFSKMTYSERVKVYEENPDAYNELTNGGNE
jgi:hypothetical protein